MPGINKNANIDMLFRKAGETQKYGIQKNKAPVVKLALRG